LGIKKKFGQRFEIEFGPAVIAGTHDAIGVKDLGGATSVDSTLPIEDMANSLNIILEKGRLRCQGAEQRAEIISFAVGIQKRLQCPNSLRLRSS